jgi:hypothetical protein
LFGAFLAAFFLKYIIGTYSFYGHKSTHLELDKDKEQQLQGESKIGKSEEEKKKLDNKQKDNEKKDENDPDNELKEKKERPSGT